MKVLVEVSGPLRRPLLRAYRKAKRKLLERGRRGLYYLEAESLAVLLPVATHKIKDVPNELDDPDKEICRQTVESADWLLLLLIMKCKGREISLKKKKKELLNIK